MAKKNERELKVCAQSGYNYKSVPAIRLMGQWLEAAGFHIGDPVLVKCEDGKLIISLDTEREELIEAEKAFLEKETRKLHERFLKEKKGLARRGSDGWAYEWKIPFGINENDKVVMFLGDLDQIDDERSILFLKSYNVPSDHKLIDTELYQAQMNCTFSNPVIEQRVIRLRKGFYDRILSKYNIDLHHLEEEVAEKIKGITKPVVFNEREVSSNISTLDGILNEGIDQEGLKSLCNGVV